MSTRFSRFLESFHLLPDNHFTHRKGLGKTDALLTISHEFQLADRGQEAWVVQLDFSAAFDRVGQANLLYS